MDGYLIIPNPIKYDVVIRQKIAHIPPQWELEPVYMVWTYNYPRISYGNIVMTTTC